MKTRIINLVIVAVAVLFVTVARPGVSSIAGTIPRTGTAVLSVSSGFTTSPNPLAGKTMVLFKERFAGFLKRNGWFEGPPGATVKESPLAVWVYTCQTGSPLCQQALLEARPNAVSEAKMDATGRATLPGVPPGTYYLFAIAPYSGQVLVWDLRVDLRPGPNSVTLDQRNTASLDAHTAQASPSGGAAQPTAASQPCKGSDQPRTIKAGARANSTLSVIGMGYVYTYTRTDRVTGAVLESFTERGNFSDTTLYLLDEDADKILQKAGVEPGLLGLGSRLFLLTFLDAGSQIENAPGADVLSSIASLLGHREDMAEVMKEMKDQFECAMKAIRAHSVSVMTTNANARGTFTGVPAGTYYLFGRFYRVKKPVRSGGMVWNLPVEVKPGQNVVRLSVDDAAVK